MERNRRRLRPHRQGCHLRDEFPLQRTTLLVMKSPLDKLTTASCSQLQGTCWRGTPTAARTTWRRCRCCGLASPRGCERAPRYRRRKTATALLPPAEQMSVEMLAEPLARAAVGPGSQTRRMTARKQRPTWRRAIHTRARRTAGINRGGSRRRRRPGGGCRGLLAGCWVASPLAVPAAAAGQLWRKCSRFRVERERLMMSPRKGCCCSQSGMYIYSCVFSRMSGSVRVIAVAGSIP